MRKSTLFFWIALLPLLQSCSPNYFNQIYSVSPGNTTISEDDGLYFENEHCRISYDFWDYGGSVRFSILNKSESTLRIKLDESFFIMNDYAYDYFKNREYTETDGKASVTIAESSTVAIPAKAFKTFSEFSINDKLIRNCDLLKYPNRKQTAQIQYSKTASPLVFSNRLTYEVGDVSQEIRNEFFVSEITNIRSAEFSDMVKTDFCNQEYSTKVLTYSGSNRFYIQYTKGADLMKY